MNERLYRSRHDRMIAGVAGGLIWELGFNQPWPSTIQLAPVAGPGAAGLGMTGRF